MQPLLASSATEPDARIALGGPDRNTFTKAVLAEAPRPTPPNCSGRATATSMSIPICRTPGSRSVGRTATRSPRPCWPRRPGLHRRTAAALLAANWRSLSPANCSTGCVRWVAPIEWRPGSAPTRMPVPIASRSLLAANWRSLSPANCSTGCVRWVAPIEWRPGSAPSRIVDRQNSNASCGPVGPVEGSDSAPRWTAGPVPVDESAKWHQQAGSSIGKTRMRAAVPLARLKVQIRRHGGPRARSVKFTQVLRGYKTSEVDWVLERLGRELGGATLSARGDPRLVGRRRSSSRRCCAGTRPARWTGCWNGSAVSSEALRSQQIASVPYPLSTADDLAPPSSSSRTPAAGSWPDRATFAIAHHCRSDRQRALSVEHRRRPGATVELVEDAGGGIVARQDRCTDGRRGRHFGRGRCRGRRGVAGHVWTGACSGGAAIGDREMTAAPTAGGVVTSGVGVAGVGVGLLGMFGPVRVVRSQPRRGRWCRRHRRGWNQPWADRRVRGCGGDGGDGANFASGAQSTPAWAVVQAA